MRITKKDFLESFANKQIYRGQVAKALKDLELTDPEFAANSAEVATTWKDLRYLDAGSQGLINTFSEFAKLFKEIDDLDDNGSLRSIDSDSMAGKLYAKILQNAVDRVGGGGDNASTGGLVGDVERKQIAANLGFSPQYQRRMSKEIKQIKKNFGDFIHKESQRQGVPESLIAGIILKESWGDPNAVGSGRDIGLMQINYSAHGFTRSTKRKLLDPAFNIKTGVGIISEQIKRFGSIKDGLRAYNWGHGNYRKFKRGQKSLPRSVRNYADTIIKYKKFAERVGF